MNHLIISNCTNRKSGKLQKIKLDQALFMSESPDLFISAWRTQIEFANSKGPAIEVYKGRSVREIVNAKKIINAKVYFLSAGLGLINEDDSIPNYDLTISKGKNSLQPLFNRWSITEACWWDKLLSKSNMQDIFLDFDGIYFIALPNNYLKMILPVLEKLERQQIERLRLFLHPISSKLLPKKLEKCYMPYDYRFELSDFSGTKVDYCQRCLHHFIKFIYKPEQDLISSFKSVESFIESLPLPSQGIKRLKMTDAEIIQIILEDWEVCKGKSTKLLRYLRDVRKVACEQSRFQKLWNDIRVKKLNGINI